MINIARLSTFQGNNLNAIKVFQSKKIEDFSMVIMENFYPKFKVKRIFQIESSKFQKRGEHAHIKCSQIFLCVKGDILLECADGRSRTQFNLNSESNMAVLVPNGIWTSQIYQPGSELIVLCNRIFEEQDYIRSWNHFLIAKKI